MWRGDFIKTVNDEIKYADFPDGFFNSWKYCNNTKNNQFCHPFMMGVLSKSLYKVDHIKYVGIDSRLQFSNNNSHEKGKWQPDLVGFSAVPLGKQSYPKIIIDFESPNSSDMRVVARNLISYKNYCNISNSEVPYIIIVCLPTQASLGWSIKYTKTGYNKLTGKDHKTLVRELKCNGPLNLWTGYWKNYLLGKENLLNGVTILNVGNGRVETIRLGD